MNETFDPAPSELNDCGCCAGVTGQTPAPVRNREGLGHLDYRVGTHDLFKRSLLAALSGAQREPLLGLNTRADDDFSIALLDGWAAVADVLIFYQERLANESYLRTATERESILQLARLIGYQLSHGVAASTQLAFKVEEAPGAPRLTTIGIGTKVQSIPGPDEKAQTFETVEKIEARVEWNAMKPQMVEVSAIHAGVKKLYLKGVATQLHPGDGILIVGDERDLHPAQYPDKERWDFRILQTVTANAEKDWTLVTWEEGLGKSPILPAEKNIKVFAFRQRAALFGHNAPDWNAMSKDVRAIYGPTNTEWPFPSLAATALELDATYPKIIAGSWVALASPSYVELCKVQTVSSVSLAKFAISGKVTRIVPDAFENTNQFHVRDTTVFAQSELLEISEAPLTTPVAGAPSALLKLDDGTLTPVEGARITLDRRVEELQSGQKLAVSGKRLRARIKAAGLSLASADGSTSVTLQREEILLALESPSVINAAQAKWHLRKHDGFEGFITTAINDIVLTSAAKEDETITEFAIVQEASGDPTTIKLQAPLLRHSYDRSTVTINANVVRATHGETVGEALGGGDASQSYQRFTLRQPHLTYIRSTGPGGAQSALQVRVNDLLWHETPMLYGRGPFERVFVARTGDDGKTTIQFGDGITGARLPTGQDNVRATYRKGIGLGGLVKAGQLTTLLTRPLGVKEALNPLPAEGAADPETLADARGNAPQTVLTLGRVVSMRDYEDFARSFAGIAKALGTWTWNGRERGVFVTVAGPKGAEIPAGGDVATALAKALSDAGEPFVPLQVKSYRPAFFKVAGTVQIEPDYEPQKVLAAVRQSLRDQFSFAARAFGQPVMLSEVIAVMQAVTGVVAVDLDTLRRTDPPGQIGLNPRLLADRPVAGADGTVAAAELLTLAAGSLEEIRNAT